MNVKKREWLNLPNLLTSIRILLVPFLVAAFFTLGEKKHLATLLIIAAAGLTDCLDGYFARKYNQITKLGKVLDPIADKLLTASVLFCLCVSKVIHWLLLAVIVVKELYMAVGTSFCLKHDIEVASDIYGKLATVLFYPSVLMAWPWHGNVPVTNIGRVLIMVSCVMSLIAAVHYTRSSVKKWEEIKARRGIH